MTLNEEYPQAEGCAFIGGMLRFFDSEGVAATHYFDDGCLVFEVDIDGNASYLNCVGFSSLSFDANVFTDKQKSVAAKFIKSQRRSYIDVERMLSKRGINC